MPKQAEEMVKPYVLVLDFVGIFDKLEKALAFDSDVALPGPEGTRVYSGEPALAPAASS